MKHYILFVFLILQLHVISGQQAVDYIFKAKALTAAGKTDLAVDLLTNAINEKKEAILYLNRAETNILRGDYSAAISDYNEANKIVPNSGEYGLSRVYSLKGDAATSAYHLEQNLRSDLKKSEKEIMLDPAFKAVERSQEWKNLWKNDWYSESEKGVSEIEYLVSAGKTDRAEEALQEMRQNSPGDDYVRYAESLVNVSRGKNSDAIKTISALVSEKPGNEKYLRLLARAQANTGNAAGASATYSQILSSGVADPALLLLRAECYRKTGETDKASADLDSYLGINPGDQAALSLAGRIAAASGDNLKALDYYSENLKLHPNDPQCYIDRGNSYFNASSWEWAIRDYSMSLDLQPGNPDVWLSKGVALLKEGKVDDACHDFRKAYSLGSKKVSEYINANCLR